MPGSLREPLLLECPRFVCLYPLGLGWGGGGLIGEAPFSFLVSPHS